MDVHLCDTPVGEESLTFSQVYLSILDNVVLTDFFADHCLETTVAK